MDYIFIKSKKPGMEEFGSVYARVRVNGMNKKYAIGFTIKIKEWERYRSLQYTASALMTSAGIKYGQFASILSQIKINLEEDFDPNTAQSIIRSIKATVVNGEGFNILESNTKNKILLTDFMAKLMEDYNSGKRLKAEQSTKVSSGYIKGMNNVRNDIINFEKTHRRRVFLDNVTMDFQRDLVKWYKDRGILPNTINTRMARLRVVMRIAYEEKKTKCNDFRSAEFVPKQVEVDEIFLTPKQIQEFLDVDLSSVEKVKELQDKVKFTKARQKELKTINPERVRHLQYSRDIFVVGCLTGQRVSDYSRICQSMITQIDNIDFICLTQTKTKKKVYIPLDKRVSKILNKYNGVLPKQDFESMNANLRYIAELLHWTWKPNIDETRMGGKKGNRFCDMLSSHTARRSFATNAHAAGVPLSSIMAITGHSSEKTLKRYLKLHAEEKAIIAAKDFEGVIEM